MRSSWKGRNTDRIIEALEEAARRDMKGCTLIDIAPGVVTRLLSSYFPPNENALAQFLGHVDELLRSITEMPIYCHEVEEILSAFDPLNPKHLFVLYMGARIEKVLPTDDERIIANPHDLESDSLLELGDVVFCYNAIPETENPTATLRNVMKSVKNGGLLSIDPATDWRLNPRTDPMFVQL
ncbi:MAG: hypothetical protein KC978_11875, partial [Candidatus Omnitrophica bacterium]|nr:hypothetical protein [Candidatus Omnitrophota bacterium]